MPKNSKKDDFEELKSYQYWHEPLGDKFYRRTVGEDRGYEDSTYGRVACRSAAYSLMSIMTPLDHWGGFLFCIGDGIQYASRTVSRVVVREPLGLGPVRAKQARDLYDDCTAITQQGVTAGAREILLKNILGIIAGQIEKTGFTYGESKKLKPIAYAALGKIIQYVDTFQDNTETTKRMLNDAKSMVSVKNVPASSTSAASSLQLNMSQYKPIDRDELKTLLQAQKQNTN